MKLGYGTYGMPKMPVSEAFAVIRSCGYQGVELCALPGTPGSPAQLTKAARPAVRGMLEELDLELPALMLGLNSLAADASAEEASLEAAIELALDLAVGPPPVLVTTPGGSAAQWDDRRHEVAEVFGRWAARAAAAGLVVALEPHVGGVVHRPEQAEWVRAQVDSPALRFNYDHSHFVLRGISPAEAAVIMVPHAVATHLKDAAGDPARFQFMLPGEGDFDYPAFFRLLAGLGYDGYLTVEVSGMVFNRPGYEPVSEARRCQEFLSAALAAAAL